MLMITAICEVQISLSLMLLIFVFCFLFFRRFSSNRSEWHGLWEPVDLVSIVEVISAKFLLSEIFIVSSVDLIRFLYSESFCKCSFLCVPTYIYIYPYIKIKFYVYKYVTFTVQTTSVDGRLLR